MLNFPFELLISPIFPCILLIFLLVLAWWQHHEGVPSGCPHGPGVWPYGSSLSQRFPFWHGDQLQLPLMVKLWLYWKNIAWPIFFLTSIFFWSMNETILVHYMTHALQNGIWTADVDNAVSNHIFFQFNFEKEENMWQDFLFPSLLTFYPLNNYVVRYWKQGKTFQIRHLLQHFCICRSVPQS